MRRFLVFMLLVALAVSAKAQFDAATVLGTITDPSGAMVVRCQVVLRNTSTATVLTATTGGQGQFNFPDVPIGPYTLEATAQGFQPSAASFELTVGARQRVDVQLHLASVASTVTATAEAMQLETDSSEHGQVVNAREIAELPLDGREYSQLVELTTGVVPSPSQLTSGYEQREGSFNVNGLRSTFNNFLLDGLDNNQYGTSNQGFSNQVVQLPPDSVAEFQMVMNNTSAEFGHSGGATVNAVTRYGTNQLHGRVWEFARNTDFNATGFFKPDANAAGVVEKPALHRNQFGGNFGGPLIKDKVFFFLDYEGYRETSSYTDKATLPTASERGENADYTPAAYATIDDAGQTNPVGFFPIDNPCPYNGNNPCTSTTLFGAGLKDYYGGTQYLNGKIPSSAIIPFASAVLAMLPATTNNKSLNNYVVLHPITVDRDKGDAKIDYNMRENLRLFTRYSQSRANYFDPGTIPGTAGGDGDGHVQSPVIQVVGGATWTISPVSVLDARFGFSRIQSGKTPVLAGGASMYDMFGLSGLPTDPTYTGGITYQDFPNQSPADLGTQFTNPQFQHPSVWNPKVNYTRQLSRHSLKAGVEFTDIHVEQQDLHPTLGVDAYAAEMSGYCYLAGCYAKYGSNLTGPDTATTTKMFNYADFLLGYRALMGISTPTIANIREWSWAGYLQDDFKLSKRLTLNLGLRYEFATPIAEANNHLSNYDPTTNSIKLASSSDRYTINPNTEDFGPRVGAAFSLNRATALRGGFGISYVHWNRVGSNYLTQNAPYAIVAEREVYPSLSTYRNTQSGYPTNPSLTDSKLYNPTEAVIQYMPANSPDAQVRSWFFGVQRDLSHNWMLDLSYVGNTGRHEVIINDVNQAAAQASQSCNNGDIASIPYVASSCTSLQSRIPDQSFGSITGTLPWGTSNYNGLQAKVEKRFSSGLYVLDSFTWSKAIDITGQSLDGGGACVNCGNGIPSVQNIYDWKADRGVSAYNRPIVNITSLVWSLPVGQGQWLLPNVNRLWNTLIGGWQMTDIFQARSGDPLSFAYSPNTNTEVSALISVYGRNAYRPNQTTGKVVASNKSYQQYFNAVSTTFSTPEPFAPFGNSPRNAVYGFAFWQLDTGLTKDFRVNDRAHVQFRAEAFNVTNRTNFGDPQTNISRSDFGETTSTRPARELQLAGKIVF
jgi:hypothetical protein